MFIVELKILKEGETAPRVYHVQTTKDLVWVGGVENGRQVRILKIFGDAVEMSVEEPAEETGEAETPGS